MSSRWRERRGGQFASLAQLQSQKRALLSPVQRWRKEWVTPTNARPGSTLKVCKWVKYDGPVDEQEREEEMLDAAVAAAAAVEAGLVGVGDDETPTPGHEVGTPLGTSNNGTGVHSGMAGGSSRVESGIMTPSSIDTPHGMFSAGTGTGGISGTNTTSQHPLAYSIAFNAESPIANPSDQQPTPDMGMSIDHANENEHDHDTDQDRDGTIPAQEPPKPPEIPEPAGIGESTAEHVPNFPLNATNAHDPAKPAEMPGDGSEAPAGAGAGEDSEMRDEGGDDGEGGENPNDLDGEVMEDKGDGDGAGVDGPLPGEMGSSIPGLMTAIPDAEVDATVAVPGLTAGSEEEIRG